MKKSKTVEEYIKSAPLDYQKSLRDLRKCIKQLVPKATEKISYGMPFYDHGGRLVYFSAMKGYIGLYVPPPIIANHAKELEKYKTTKSAIHLPFKKLPFSLIKKLIKARMKYLKKVLV